MSIQPGPVAPAPRDPYANKTMVAAVGTIVTVGLRWAVSGHLNLDDEGLVSLAGAITTLGVYVMTNHQRLSQLLRGRSSWS